jgi:filamentous hemagglutinin family protein
MRYYLRPFLLSTTALTTALLCVLIHTPASANPQEGTVSAGTAAISESGKTVSIDQLSHKAVIDWRSFDIAPDEHTRFIQPSADAITLNRVNSNNPSHINGALTANGNVIIVNQNGVLFGGSARVDVNGLIATTADIDTDKFMREDSLVFDRAGKPDAAVTNEGQITVKEAGLVGFVAPNVTNSGIITARMGRVQLASGDTATVDMYGDGLVNVAVSDAVQSQLVANSGVINAEGGQIYMTAAAGRQIVNSLIDVKGTLTAQSVSQRNGEIIISAGGSNKTGKSGAGTVNIKAKLDVSGRKPGEKGGNIQITADQIITRKETTLDASGDQGGGTIRIGGDYQGGNSIPAAWFNFTEDGAHITADALTEGDGGRIILWSDHITRFYGQISARGGAAAGNGGFVEVSGKEILTFKGDVDTQAANGATGMLLLDPADIIIANGVADSAADGTGTFSGNPSGGTGVILSGDTGPTTLYESELEGLLATTSLSLAATNSITINNLSDNALTLAQTAGRSVAFSAGAGGIIMADTNDAILVNGGTLTFTTASGGGVTLGNLDSNGGLVTFNVDGTSTVGGTISGTGAVTKSGNGALTLSGNNSYSGTTTLTAGTLTVGSNTALGTGTLSFNGGTLSGDGTARTLGNAMSLVVNSTIAGSSDLTLNGVFTNTNTRTLTVDNAAQTTLGGTVNLSNSATNRTLTITGTGNLAITGAVQNGGTATTSAITKTGNGTLSLSGTNTYGGTTTLSAGMIAVGNNAALGTGTLSLGGGTLSAAGSARTINNAVSLSANSTIGGSTDLTINGIFTNTGNRLLTLDNTGLTTLGGTVNLSNSASNFILSLGGAGNLTISGAVENGGTATGSSITKSGGGTVTFSGNNTYAGTTTISGGTLVAGSNTALGTSTLSLSSGTLSGDGTARTLGNTANLVSASAAIGGTSDLTLSGTFTNTNNYTLTVNNTALTTLSGTVNLSNAATNRTLTLAGTGDITISGTVQNGSTSTSGAILKTNTGTLTMSGVNTFGGTFNNSAGTVVAGSNTPFGLGGFILNGTLKGDGTPRTLNNFTTLNGSSIIGGTSDLTFAGSFTNTGNHTLTINNSGATAFTNTFSLSNSASNYTLTLAGTGNLSLNGVIQNGGTATASNLTKDGAGTLTISGNNTYTGTTIINNGTFRLGAANRISNSSAVTVDSSGLFDLNSFNETVNSLTNNGTVTMGSGNTLTTVNGQTHGGSITGNNVTLASNGGGNIVATNAANDFTGNLGLSTTGDASIADTNDLAFGTVSVRTLTARAANGDITLNGQVTASATTGTSILLSTGDQFKNTFGATALQTSGSARFLVFSQNAADDTRGSITGFNRYGCGYNAGSPNCAAGTDTPVTGSGFYYANAPTLTISGLTGANKVYDGTTIAMLSGTATLNGLLNGDTPSVDAGGASIHFANKNVGAGKNISVSGLALGGPNMGYLLTQPSGFSADITPRPLTLAAFAANDKVYDGTTAATIGSYSFDAAVAGDNLSLSGLAAQFDTADAGTHKRVTVSGGTFSGSDAGNYSFTLGGASAFASITSLSGNASPVPTTPIPNTVLVVSQTAESSYRPPRENRSHNTETNIYVMGDSHFTPEPVLVKISTGDGGTETLFEFSTPNYENNYRSFSALKSTPYSLLSRLLRGHN